MSLKIKSIFAVASVAFALTACGAQDEHPGTEYAPQMYESVAYEPLKEVANPEGSDEVEYKEPNSLPFNDYFIGVDEKGQPRTRYAQNMRQPVEGTVRRQNYSAVTGSYMVSDTAALLIYNLHKDSVAMAGRILKNPIKLDTAANGNAQLILDQGKHLYIGYCATCHGENGKGDGKVGEAYKGVANLTGGSYRNLPEGHIFHVITNGKGRMWPHKSQLNPEERWKIVHYVKNVIQK